MPTCSCGETTGSDCRHCDRCAALRVLDLEADASAEEIKDAYHSMAKVWHPDRFEHDVVLRKLAEDKFKRINAAYQGLGKPSSRSYRKRTPPASASAPTPSAVEAEREAEVRPAWEPRPPAPRPILQPGVSPVTVLLLCGLLTLGVTGVALSNTAVGQHLRSAACALGPRECDFENSSVEDFFGSAFSEIRKTASSWAPGGRSGHSPTDTGNPQLQSKPGDRLTPAAATAPAPAGGLRAARSVAASGPPNRLLLHDGTPVRLRIVYPVSLAASNIGQAIDWEVVHDVLSEGAVAIPRGAKASGIVSGLLRLSAAPKLTMNVEQVVLASGLAIPLETNADQSQNLDFYQPRSADDAAIPAGTEITVFVHGNIALPALANASFRLPRDSAADSILPDGTPVRLRLIKEVDAEEAAVGDHIAFEVAGNVAVNDEIVAIRRGTIAWGTVTEAMAGNGANSGGRVAVKVEIIRLSDGSPARLRGIETAAAPAAGGKVASLRSRLPHWLISPKHANDTVIPQGSELIAYIDGDVQFRPPAQESIRR